MRSIISTYVQEDTRVLLVGGGGRLGKMLTQHWPDSGQLLVQSRQGGDGVLRFDPLDDPKALLAAAAGVQAVVCMAGITPAHAAATGDAMDLNTDLAMAALRAAPDGARVFLVSSAAVYGVAHGPHSEGAAVHPVSEYGHAKRAMELAALAQGEGRVCILRIGNVAGADAILGGWRTDMAIDQMPDGRTPRRSYIGPKTLAQVIHALCAVDVLPDIINVAAPGVIEMGALLDAAGLDWVPRVPDGNVIEEVALDTRALERLYTFASDECTAQGMVAQWNEESRQA